MISVLGQQIIDSPSLKQEGQPAPSASVDRPVSQWSTFSDQKWILSTKVTINWAKPPMRMPLLDKTKFQVLMNPVKVLADILLNEEGLSPLTVHNEVGALKEFVGWMLTRPVAIKRFKYVRSSVFADYFKQASEWPALTGRRRHSTSESKTLGRTSLIVRVHALTRLYDYRDRLEDALQKLPPALSDIPSQEGKGSRRPCVSATLPIPDEAQKELLGAAVDFVREHADHIIANLKKLIKESELFRVQEALGREHEDKFPQDTLKETRHSISKALLRFKEDKLTRLKPGTPISINNLAIESEVSFELCVACLSPNTYLRISYGDIKKTSKHHISWDALRHLLDRVCLLQTACFVIVATSTGMRLGELLALKPGCVVKRRVRGYESPLYWLKSLLIKTSPNLSGDITFWLCGELATEAIRVLERLHDLMPTTLKVEQNRKPELEPSLFRSYVWNGIVLEAKPMAGGTVSGWMQDFIRVLKLSVGYVHPHQFRRTFARNVVRWSDAPILALQRHFKHWSLLMTDYYVGLDYELVEVYLSEQQADSRNRLRQIMAGECGGPGGLISNKRLIKMADDERLPLNFRGEERGGTIEDLVNEMCEDGVVAYKCGEITTCLYVPGLAKCGEDGPQAHECHPTECVNSYILVEDVPFYLHNIRQNLSSYKKQRDLNKRGPIGQFFLERIRRDVVCILPLVQPYAEKLRRLQAHYDELDETEKVGSYGKVLRDRIERDAVTLQFVAEGAHV
jgi:integrase